MVVEWVAELNKQRAAHQANAGHVTPSAAVGTDAVPASASQTPVERAKASGENVMDELSPRP